MPPAQVRPNAWLSPPSAPSSPSAAAPPGKVAAHLFVTLLLFLSQLLHLEVHAGAGGSAESEGVLAGHPLLPPAGAPLGLCLLVTLGLLGPALPLGLHVPEHGLGEAQVPRLQHTGDSVQRGHLATGC